MGTNENPGHLDGVFEALGSLKAQITCPKDGSLDVPGTSKEDDMCINVQSLSERLCIAMDQLASTIKNKSNQTPSLLLSTTQKSLLKDCLEFMLVCKLIPSFPPGVGVPLRCRLKHYQDYNKWLTLSDVKQPQCPATNCRLIVDIWLRLWKCHPEIEALICRYYLNDLVAAILISLHHSDQLPSSLVSEYNDFLDTLYPPSFIRELLTLQSVGGQPPSWLLDCCGQRLSRTLSRAHGLRYLLMAIEDLGGGDSALDNSNQIDSIAHIVSKCPKAMSNSREQYYSTIVAEVKELFATSDQRMCRIAVAILHKFTSETQRGIVDKQLLYPLFEPLLRLQHSPEALSSSSLSLLNEIAVNTVHSLCLLRPPSDADEHRDPLERCLELTADLLLAAVSDLQATDSVLLIGRQLREVLVSYLSRCSLATAERRLRALTMAAFVDAEFAVERPSEQQPSTSVLCARARVAFEFAGTHRASTLLDVLAGVESEERRLDLVAALCSQLLMTVFAQEATVSASDSRSHFLRLEQKMESGQRLMFASLLLTGLLERFQEAFLQHREKMVKIVQELLSSEVASLGEEQDTELLDIRERTLSLLMAVFSTIIMSATDETALKDASFLLCMDHLEALKHSHRSTTMRETCATLLKLLVEAGVYHPEAKIQSAAATTNKKHQEDAEQKLKRIKLDLDDVLAPVRGHALIEMTKAIRARDPVFTEQKDQLLILAIDKLADNDSYVYLSAINCVTVVAADDVDTALPLLLSRFDAAVSNGEQQALAANIGEALAKLCRCHLGDCTPFVAVSLADGYLRLVSQLNDVEQPTMVASVLSCLADLVAVSAATLYRLSARLQEIVHCACQHLQGVHDDLVRRAASHLLGALIKGSSMDLLELLGDSLRDVYRLLKRLNTTDADVMVRLHCQLCLEALNATMGEKLLLEIAPPVRQL